MPFKKILSIIIGCCTLTLDPNIRNKLLEESRNPFKGLRRIVWFLVSACAVIGLLIMIARFISGESVLIKDFIIQSGALILFGSLMTFDRDRPDDENEKQ